MAFGAIDESSNLSRATMNPCQDGVRTLGSAMVLRGGLGLRLGLNSRNFQDPSHHFARR